MHIAIFTISKKKFYLDIDIKTNKIVAYTYKERKKNYLKIKDVLSFVSELFDQMKMVFLKKAGDYDMYLNKDTKYLHFFKDGQENYLKFFLENGHSAILYYGDNNIKDRKFSKLFKNSKTKNKFYLTLYSIFIIYYIYTLPTALENFNNDIAEYQQVKEYSNPKIFSEALTFSENLTKSEKKLLENETLFQDIAATKIDYDRSKSLEEKLDNISIIEYTKEEKEQVESGKLKAVGYYNHLIPNQLFVYNLKDSDTKVHEFIHLLEENNEYHYIVEALTEILKKEYYQEQILDYKSTYKKEQIRTKVLMKIIGPEVLWDMLFTGDTEEFENTIESLLSQEESERFLSLISPSPSKLEDEERLKNHQEIDKLLENMYQNKYQESMKECELISLIYAEDEKVIFIENNRRYFNDAENKENRVDFSIIENTPLKTLKDKGKVEVNAYFSNMFEIKYEEYAKNKNRSSEEVRYYRREHLKDYDLWQRDINNNDNTIYINTKTSEVKTFAELREMGETYPVYFKEIREIISLEEATYIINQEKYQVDGMLDRSLLTEEKGNLKVEVRNPNSTEKFYPTIEATERGYEYQVTYHEELTFTPASEKNSKQVYNNVL